MPTPPDGRQAYDVYEGPVAPKFVETALGLLEHSVRVAHTKDEVDEQVPLPDEDDLQLQADCGLLAPEPIEGA
eukprot:CAMPEP_0202385562 /NCGR_PEP_ID=MMETSP1127-20130417/61535_1 /ASSEMBLY_ACC=CAM_ASM_000462 /TAXON_ID=3047 /ORGANISM="Dunaliella tertiolecta, Strain CCMP1320" /LENGTH=72 /DNA_ID=CAMNT_0048985773 /DNA_START=345 /DNA_END=564 /DNA_ORIENTATION=-